MEQSFPAIHEIMPCLEIIIELSALSPSLPFSLWVRNATSTCPKTDTSDLVFSLMQSTSNLFHFGKTILLSSEISIVSCLDGNLKGISF